MSSVVLNVLVCAPILVAGLAVSAIGYWSRLRQRRRRAEWERLDAQLDRTWAEEQARIRRDE